MDYCVGDEEKYAYNIADLNRLQVPSDVAKERKNVWTLKGCSLWAAAMPRRKS